MTTETELINQALGRDLERHDAAVDPHERQRIFDRMTDTVMHSTGCLQGEAAVIVRDKIMARGA